MKDSRFFTTIPAILLGIVLGVCSTPVFAVDDLGFFELDSDGPHHADALDNGFGNDGDDWQNIYDDNDSALRTTEDDDGNRIIPDAFVPANTDMIFTGGGSKDELDIDDWLWKRAKPTPDKDNITNAAAAAYMDPITKDLIIYFGADRFANNGAADIGFWFFQNDITIDDPEASQGGFVNLHEPGDVLVLATFTRGGEVSSVYVYEWVESGGDTSDHLQELGQFAECDGNGQWACALSNSNEADNVNASPWPFDPKFGDTGFFPKNSLFEGGINVSKLFNGNTPCFASFMAETRSSPSTDAVLKDFVLEKFELCGIYADKTCDADLNDTGDVVDVDFWGNVVNTGAIEFEVELYDSELGSAITDVCYDLGGVAGQCDDDATDPPPINLVLLPDGSATFTLPAGDTVLYEGDYAFTGVPDDLIFVDIITALATVNEKEVARAEPDADCEPPVTVDISVTKICTPSFENGDTFRAEITGGATNDGNVKLINVTLTDNVFPPEELTIVNDINGNGLVDPGEPDFDHILVPGGKLAYTATFQSTTATSHFNEATAYGENVFDPGTGPGKSDDDTASTTADICKIAPKPDLSIKKECDESINGTGVRLVQNAGLVSVEVGNVITVTNTGNEDMNVEVSDSEAALVAPGWNPGICATHPPDDMNCITGLLQAGNPDPGDGSNQVVIQRVYSPDGANIIGALTNPGSVFFKNTATVSGGGVISTTFVGPLDDTAECKICPPCPDCVQ